MLESGRTIGRYRIEGTLGSGGMGFVYRAYDTLLRRETALKVLAGETTAESRARLLREARAAAALKHPNAVAVFDVGELEGTPFIAMEVVEGVPLRARMEDPSLPVDTKLQWLAAVADVLAAAHEAGIIHRDVKPENVMVCRDGGVKVLDFGIARRAQAPEPARSDDGAPPSSFRTAEGRLVGTPRYMAPEQRTGGVVDERADQYAWGLVAGELLCGVHPRTVSPAELRTQTLSVSFATPPEIEDETPQTANSVRRIGDALIVSKQAFGVHRASASARIAFS